MFEVGSLASHIIGWVMYGITFWDAIIVYLQLGHDSSYLYTRVTNSPVFPGISRI